MYIPRIYIGLFFYVTLNLLQKPDSIADKPMQQGCKGFAAALPKPCSMQGDTFMASQADHQATRLCPNADQVYYTQPFRLIPSPVYSVATQRPKSYNLLRTDADRRLRGRLSVRSYHGVQTA